MAVQIAHLQAADRPRERLDRLGAGSLTDAELVALILRSGGRDTSAIALAEGLLAEHGGISGLARKAPNELCHERLMGPAKASALVAGFELARRLQLQPSVEARAVRGPEDIVALAKAHLHRQDREECLVVVLDPRKRVLRVECLTVGTDDRCLLSPRDVLRAVLKHQGAALALVHTHPSGDPRPSSEDIVATRGLQTASEAVGVELIDHVVIAGRRWCSVVDQIGTGACAAS